MLVLPGITSPAITWDFVVAELRDLVRPVVLDLRGRGLSARGPSYALSDYAADAEAVVDRLGLGRPILLGHSLGGRIAAVVAARGRIAVHGTVVVDPPLSGPGRGGYPTPRSSIDAQLAEGRRGTTADEVRRYYPAWPRTELALRARWLPSCDETAVMESYERFSREDFFEAWPDVPAPVALIRGAESPVVTETAAREVIAANPTVAARDVPAAGHMVPWDNPGAFLTTLRSLLIEQFGIPVASAAAA